MEHLIRFGAAIFPAMLIAQQPTAPASGIPVLQDEPTDAQERAQRDARGKMFNFSGPDLPLGPGFTNDYRFVTALTMRLLSELPIGESDMVAIGEITGSNVFVAKNKKALYTEFTFSLERMVKPTGGAVPEAVISVVRLGGVAQRPSGGIIRHEVVGYGPDPSIGSKYLMFLKHTPAPADAYAILKFWNIRAGVVSAAFADDAQRVKEVRSIADGKMVSEVVAIMEASLRDPASVK